MTISHVIIRVGDTHHGSLIPGILIVVPNKDNKFSYAFPEGIYFENPVDGGYSYGEFIKYVDLEDI